MNSGNLTSVHGVNDEKIKKINNFKSYLNILKSEKIILDQEKRRSLIINKMNSICNARRLKNYFNEKLIDEVVNLVEKKAEEIEKNNLNNFYHPFSNFSHLYKHEN